MPEPQYKHKFCALCLAFSASVILPFVPIKPFSFKEAILAALGLAGNDEELEALELLELEVELELLLLPRLR